MKSNLIPIWFVLCAVLWSCKDNVVCPAFQSTYILDDSVRFARYSLFENDSTPKFAMASRRTKYGVNKKTSLFRKNYELMTAPKVNVLAPEKEDSLYSEDEGDFLVSDFVDSDSLAVDSLGIDSVAVAPLFAKAEKEGPKYKYRYRVDDDFNHDQVYYNKYFGDLFEEKKPPVPTEEELEALKAQQEAGGDSLGVEQPKKKGFFKKRNKEQELPDDEPEVDSETLEEATESSEEKVEEEPENEETPTEQEEETPKEGGEGE